MRCLTSDKWFDAACRPICPALAGHPGRAIHVMPAACIQHDERLNHSYGYAFRRPPCGLIPPLAMMASAVVNSSGWRLNDRIACVNHKPSGSKF